MPLPSAGVSFLLGNWQNCIKNVELDMTYLIYDCEIEKLIPSRNEPLEPCFKYCEGWTDYKGMGISVIGYLAVDYGCISTGYVDFSNDKSMIEPILNRFKTRVSQSDLVIGFNSRNFDDKLLAANGIEVETRYDLLEQIRIAAFGSPRWQDTPRGRTYKLDAIARANGLAKTGTGELAPKLWQQGKKQEVIDYCVHDTKITYDLMRLGIQGRLIDPNTGEALKLEPVTSFLGKLG